MPLNTGARLGQYEITGSLGAGGMGEVYRARDTRLHRDVAIKILPTPFMAIPSAVPGSSARRTSWPSLNHPNIAHIHGIEESSGQPALVMELVEGHTLDQLDVPAHDRRHHRHHPSDRRSAGSGARAGDHSSRSQASQLKVRGDGTVKVLDFGLAKAFDASSRGDVDAMNSPTLTVAAFATGYEIGMVVGTAVYMAPEQARGKPVDRRADIWALGAVLFELLTNARAFEGETVSDTIAAVLTIDPDWSKIRPTHPRR